MIILNLPWPPSVNRCYRSIHGRSILSKVAREYREAVVALIGPSVPLEGRLKVEMYMYPPTKRQFDIDNYVKAQWDALQAAGVIKNDNQIDKLYIERMAVEKGGKVLVEITEE